MASSVNIKHRISHWSYIITFIIVCASIGLVEGNCIGSQDDIEHYFAKKTNSSYWKWIKPPGPTTEVTVSMQINQIAFHNEAESTIDIQILFEMEWIDNRLKFNGTDCNNMNSSKENFTIEGNEWHLSKIWVPSLRISRNKLPNVLSSRSSTQIIFLRITHEGRIRVRMRQQCRITLVSNTLPSEKLQLTWSKHAKLIVDNNLFIASHSLESCSFSNGQEMVRNETFSTLTVALHLKRQWGHHMLVVFFPSMLIVATSWLSFWVEITSPPARITLCVTTLLAMVTVSKEALHDLPKVPYVKATDLWFAGCTVSIFLTLIEYVIVAYTFRAESLKYKARKKLKRTLSANSLYSNDTTMPSTPLGKLDSASWLTPFESERFSRRFSSNARHLTMPNNGQTPPPRIHFTFSPPESPNISPSAESDISQLLKDTPQEVAESIDRKSRIIFPFMFALFNLIYWSFYI
ncbi:hypothetical protein RDWZM_005835 [Blomia tropicalis]|uniref:Uncharacterized protein n=1 Tax=Blomia tropicalis TaxID=40697 RepID=A0A9Q0M4S7_BLOTA|nr:hypothetical protein RDWZM_005835 [Blomia tropicalis]